MKVWITQYATTKGIIEVDDKDTNLTITIEIEYVYVRADGHNSNIYKVGKDVELTKSEAITQANKKVASKIKACEKQLAKLKALKF